MRILILMVSFLFFLNVLIAAESGPTNELDKVKAVENKKSAVGVAANYFPNTPVLLEKKGLSRTEVIAKLTGAQVDVKESKVTYKTDNGEVTFWYTPDDKVKSARMTFNIQKDSITSSELTLMKNFKDEIRSMKFRPSPHSRFSQIQDKENSMGIQVIHSYKASGSPRIREIFFADGFFK